MLATSADKQAAMDKLSKLIEEGRATAGGVIEHVMNHQPKDTLAKVQCITFDDHKKITEGVTEASQLIMDVVGTEGYSRGFVHRHALSQMATIAGIPTGFAEQLRTTDWGTNLLAVNLNSHFANKLKQDNKYLIRSLDNSVRGFLSDRYRRLDSRPLVEAFAKEVAAAGAMPYKGTVTDTKINIAAIFPEIYEPIPGEMVAYGITLENSDFGNGALSLRSHMLRIWCNNLMVTEETMRTVHLGKRLDDAMIYSQETYNLDSQTVVSALSDIVKTQLVPDVIEFKMRSIAASDAVKLDAVEVKARLKALQQGGLLSKGEAEKAGQIFELGGVEAVPQAPTLWKLSNAISWVAGQSESSERRLDLTKVAGQMLAPAA